MSETEPFYAVHIKFMGRNEEQYKAFIRIMLKMGSKISYTAPLTDDTSGEVYGFINFIGSAKYQEAYTLE